MYPILDIKTATINQFSQLASAEKSDKHKSKIVHFGPKNDPFTQFWIQ